MTAPVYEDTAVVDGFMLASFHKIVKEAETDSLVQRVATAAIKLWEERDKARQTAAIQDAQIHKITPRLYRLEQLWTEIRITRMSKRIQRRVVLDLLKLEQEATPKGNGGGVVEFET